LAWRNYGFAQTTGPMSPTNDLKARWSLAVCADDWPAALSAAQGLTTMVAAQAAEAQVSFRGFYTNPLATLYQPRLALALARTGRLAEAGDLISALPLDCYLCLRTRGAIAAASGEARDADHWFAEAVRQGPSLPFAYLEWARAKLARGDAAGAIAQLAIARAKAPKFADIDELWGEALARRGDLRGAVTRYARADALAPHWGRLHKEWGEALQRLGRIGEARTQFAAAARMDLSNADRAELARRGG
jgi:tetratricopeptide (TPR) repeat protein